MGGYLLGNVSEIPVGCEDTRSGFSGSCVNTESGVTASCENTMSGMLFSWNVQYAFGGCQ